GHRPGRHDHVQGQDGRLLLQGLRQGLQQGPREVHEENRRRQQKAGGRREEGREGKGQGRTARGNERGGGEQELPGAHEKRGGPDGDGALQGQDDRVLLRGLPEGIRRRPGGVCGEVEVTRG